MESNIQLLSELTKSYQIVILQSKDHNMLSNSIQMFIRYN